MVVKRSWLAGVCSLLAACGGGDGLGPPLPPCTSGGFPVNLVAPGEYAAIDPRPIAGCTVFPANGSGSPIEYLLVPQSASSKPNDSQGFKLQAAALALVGIAPGFAAQQAPPPSAELAPAEQFHRFLRQSERARSYPVPPRPQRAPGAQLAAQAPPPPRRPYTVADSGNVYSFKVCGNLDCTTLPTVNATLMKIGQHIAIYVDTNAPSPRLSQADLDGLRAVFDTLLYEVDTLAFGRESDIDANGVVIVLMTNRVNQLVPAPTTCPDGFVAGFFFGADIDPFFGPQYNNGEIFYTFVADQAGTLSCRHDVAQVTRLVPLTLVHEFQHMISYNQHVLVRGREGEILWLNEALSHYAEERAGRSFLPGDSLNFCRFVASDLHNAGQYLLAPHDYFLVDTAGIGGLAERGAYWLFLRYLIDQFADPSSASPPSLTAADVYTRTLVNTPATGVTNVVQRAASTPFATLVSRWALANWVSDLPGFTAAPPELKYKTWAFRSAYPLFSQASSWQCTNQLPSTFPLDPGVSAGSAVDLSGVLRTSSGMYHRAQHDVGAPGFTLLFSDDAGRALRTTLVPRLNVIRIQ